MWLKCETAIVMNFHFLTLNEHCSIQCWGNSRFSVSPLWWRFWGLLAIFVSGRHFFLLIPRFDVEFAGLKLFFLLFHCCNSLCLLSFLLCVLGGFKMLYAILFSSLGTCSWGKYNIIPSFFLPSSQILHHSFISLMKQEKVVGMEIYDGVLKAMQCKRKHEKSSFQLLPASKKMNFNYKTRRVEMHRISLDFSARPHAHS